jgi:hypothetical protein
MGASTHCGLVPAAMTTAPSGARLRASGAELEEKQMDPMAMLLTAVALILAMDVLGAAPRTDRRSHN